MRQIAATRHFVATNLFVLDVLDVKIIVTTTEFCRCDLLHEFKLVRIHATCLNSDKISTRSLVAARNLLRGATMCRSDLWHSVSPLVAPSLRQVASSALLRRKAKTHYTTNRCGTYFFYGIHISMAAYASGGCYTASLDAKDVHAQNVPTQIFFNLAMQKGNDLLLPKRQKKWVTDFILERICPPKYPTSPYKPQNIAIRSLM